MSLGRHERRVLFAVRDEGPRHPAPRAGADLREVLPPRPEPHPRRRRHRARPLHLPGARAPDGRPDLGRLARGRGLDLLLRAAGGRARGGLAASPRRRQARARPSGCRRPGCAANAPSLSERPRSGEERPDAVGGVEVVAVAHGPDRARRGRASGGRRDRARPRTRRAASRRAGTSSRRARAARRPGSASPRDSRRRGRAAARPARPTRPRASPPAGDRPAVSAELVAPAIDGLRLLLACQRSSTGAATARSSGGWACASACATPAITERASWESRPRARPRSPRWRPRRPAACPAAARSGRAPPPRASGARGRARRRDAAGAPAPSRPGRGAAAAPRSSRRGPRAGRRGGGRSAPARG